MTHRRSLTSGLVVKAQTCPRIRGNSNSLKGYSPPAGCAETIRRMAREVGPALDKADRQLGNSYVIRINRHSVRGNHRGQGDVPPTSRPDIQPQVPIAGSVKVASANAGGVHIQPFWGEDMTQWKGSRVGLKNGGERIVVHRPHTGSVTGRATARDIAAFLDAAGVVAPREQDDE